jgi:hypothetical protein
LLLLGTTGLPEQAVFPTCSLSSSELDRARPHSIAVRKMFQYGFQTYIPTVRETRTARDVGVFGAVGTAAILANPAMFAGKRVAAPICDGSYAGTGRVVIRFRSVPTGQAVPAPVGIDASRSISFNLVKSRRMIASSLSFGILLSNLPTEAEPTSGYSI